jgi:recombination protein RecA
MFGRGISRSGDVLDLAVEAKIVDKSGAWYSYSGDRIGQGRDNTRKFLEEERPDLLAEIEHKVLAEKGIVRPNAPAAAESPNKVTAKSSGKATKKSDPEGEGESESKANGNGGRRAPRAN